MSGEARQRVLEEEQREGDAEQAVGGRVSIPSPWPDQEPPENTERDEAEERLPDGLQHVHPVGLLTRTRMDALELRAGYPAAPDVEDEREHDEPHAGPDVDRASLATLDR